MNTATHQAIALSALVPSTTNPRKHFDKAALAELAESIGKHGVLQPILARPKPGKDGVQFEVVAGERRYRAAGIAKLTEIPALVRDISDVEALEIQMIENLQREDLHPLEEADGYDQLVKSHEYTVKGIADKVGKSTSYVDKRLKLCALGPAAREAFQRGTLSATTALMIARIPVPDLQRKAVGEITRPGWQGPMTPKEASDHIQRNYMLRLEEASFDKTDAMLVPAAGSCATCPKRTGNHPGLFEDIDLKKGDLCTDPKCFALKRTAHREQRLEKAKASGQVIISGPDAKKVKPLHYGKLNGYVAISEPCLDDPKNRQYGQLLGKTMRAPALLDDPHTGDVVEVYPLSEVSRLIQEKFPKMKSSARPITNPHNEKMREQERKAKLERDYRTKVLAAIRANAGKREFDLADLVMVATEFYTRVQYDSQKRICDQWGWGETFIKDRDGPSKTIAALKAPDLCRLLIDCALIDQTQVSAYGTRKPAELFATAKRYKVDVEKIRAELTAAAKAKSKTAKKSKKT